MISCFACESVDQGKRELRRVGHASEVAAGKLDELSMKSFAYFDGGLVGGVAPRFRPGGREDPMRVRGQRVPVQGCGRILAQLVLEPVRGMESHNARMVAMASSNHATGLDQSTPKGSLFSRSPVPIPGLRVSG